MRWSLVVVGLLCCCCLGLAQGKTQGGKLTPEELEKLLKEVELPKGDPIPDFVDPPWLPPQTDQSKMNKRGTDFGPALSFTVQLDKKTFVRRGLTIRLPGDQAVLYDLDTLALAASWHGGFLDISATHFEDNKGRLPGRPGGAVTRWLLDQPGWAYRKDFSDPRKNQIGKLPSEHVEYRGHFLHGYRTILSYRVQGRDVFEMPGVDDHAPVGVISRTFYIGPGNSSLQLALPSARPGKMHLLRETQYATKNASVTFSQYQLNDQTSIGLALIDAPEHVVVTSIGNSRCLAIPSSEKPLRFKLAMVQGDAKAVTAMERYFQKHATAAADLRNYVRGGERRWKDDMILQGKLGDGQRDYTVDTLTLPAENPYKAWIRPAAIDFFSDGRLAMSSMNGDVWICHGIDKSLKKLRWQRFATGLYEPLGLKIVDDRLYVLGRDRISRLFDLNGDGEADYYQTFWADGIVSPGYHAFSFELQTDSKGNFYFLKSGRKADDTNDHNALIQVSADAAHWKVVATGFRHPNGMGIGPNDEIVVSDNQGEFIPSSQINWIEAGKYYGYGKLDPNYATPFLCFPMKQDNSSGGQLWAPKDWGPLSGKLLHTSYGTCKLFCVFPQFEGKKLLQATAMPLDDLAFRSGIMRGRINPIDGQVYLSGLRGWGTTAKEDGCVQRVRYTGKPSRRITQWELVPGGVRLEFSCAIDGESAINPDNFKVEQWNYIYSAKYGSPEMSVNNPKQKGHDTLAVSGIVLGKNGRSLTLRIPELQPVDQLHMAMQLRDANGHAFSCETFSTLRNLAK